MSILNVNTFIQRLSTETGSGPEERQFCFVQIFDIIFSG